LSKTRPSPIPTTGNTTIHRELSIMCMCRRTNLGQIRSNELSDNWPILTYGTALILLEFTKMLSAKFQASGIRRCVLDYSSVALNIKVAFPTKRHNQVPVNVQHKTHKFTILPSVLYGCKIYSF
jgi:hypothetical protein